MFNDGSGSLLLRICLERQQRTGVPAGKLAAFQQLAHIGAESEQAQAVCHGRARFADARGGFLLRHLIVFHQGLVALGLFDGVEILALQVFDQRQLGHLAVVCFNDDGGHLLKSCDARGAPAALAGDDLIVAGGKLSHGQRLKNAVLANGIGEIVQRGFVEIFTRLIAVGFDLGNGKIKTVARVGFERGVAEQRAETFAEPAVCTCHNEAPF